MPLPTPKKGTARATGRVRPSRAELLMNANRELASEQLPDEYTMSAIEGATPEATAATQPQAVSLPAAPTPQPMTAPQSAGGSAAIEAAPRHSRDAGANLPENAAHPGSVDAANVVLRPVPVAEIRPSPFQPKGRPSAAAVEAVRQAIADVGSLEALVGPEGSALFTRLDAEAARLAELAYDIATNGMKLPLEVRTAEDGATECLSGHRRLAAARLAGHDTVPAIHRGAMTSAAAAATVLRGNLHRENFTTWQEAVLVTEVQERRRADGYRDNVRSLGAVMGWSHGKVNMLLRIRKALSPQFLRKVGSDDDAQVEEVLARATYRELERLAAEPDEARREVAVRRLLGWTTPSTPVETSSEREWQYIRYKRGGGFVIEVNAPVESLPAGDVEKLRETLDWQLTLVRERLEALAGRGPTGQDGTAAGPSPDEQSGKTGSAEGTRSRAARSIKG